MLELFNSFKSQDIIIELTLYEYKLTYYIKLIISL